MQIALLRKKFSSAAENYDIYAHIQKAVAQRLLERLSKGKIYAQRILDIGTGTGNLLSELNLLYPEAKIFALDIAENMLFCARKKAPYTLFVQADAKIPPFKKESFDLVVSNLSLQWVKDKENTFHSLFRILKKEGRLSFSIFGPETLKELKTIFPGLADSLNLPDINTLRYLLETAGFLVVDSERIIEKKCFASMLAIIKWLKNIGANYIGYIPAKNLGMRKFWQDKEAEYKKSFSFAEGVGATFEIIFIQARKA